MYFGKYTAYIVSSYVVVLGSLFILGAHAFGKYRAVLRNIEESEKNQ